MIETVTITHPLLSGYGALAVGGLTGPEFVTSLRREAAARFEETGLPSRKVEEWRFTGVKGLADVEFAPAGPPILTPTLEPQLVAGAHRLVFVDGRLHVEMSDVGELPPGVTLEGLTHTLEREPESLEPYLGRTATHDANPFVALNTAQFSDGAVLRVAAGAVVEGPIQLLFVVSDHGRPTMNLPRILIVVGAASQATVVESYLGGSDPSFSCVVSEVFLDQGAVVDHYKVVEEGAEATHIASLQIHQARDSAFRSHSFCLGGKLIRNDIATTLEGPGADATLNGLSLTNGRQHVDNQLRVKHAAPNCTSRQLYKGVLGDTSRAVFNGRIVVAQDAQKTDARQANRNLLLSDGARAHSNPQLEIFADDVRCTHGSTVGRLDEDAIFYPRSRGIGRAAAESLLTFAFASEIVDGVRVDQTRQQLRNHLQARLPGARLVEESL